MSAKTYTITVRERPPCEFEDAEDLRRHVEFNESRRKQEMSEPCPDWNEVLTHFKTHVPKRPKDSAP